MVLNALTDICVVYLSEDEAVVERLVALLRKRWDVWWARDISYGDWEEVLREQILQSAALVPVFSEHATSERTTILRDEIRLADAQKMPILPFLIGPAQLPMGFGGLHRTEAYGWDGDEEDPGYRQLESRIATAIGSGHGFSGELARPRSLAIRGKTLALPAFVFSLSSHETQITPRDGLTLLRMLGPEALLVSAYDASKYLSGRGVKKAFSANVKQVCQSETVLFVDSGNYEAYRKDDRYNPRRNPGGWKTREYRETAARLSPDLVFSFDMVNPKGNRDEVASTIVRRFRNDDKALRERDFPLCPIIHLPQTCEGEIAACASQITAAVASELRPLMIAIPERELGDGIRQRASTVRAIRTALNSLGRYYPLHLLGTGNPLSMLTFAAAGADAFDGLEWCRVVADYQYGHLFHFQQFDCFRDMCLGRVRDRKIRLLIETPGIPYAMKVVSYNVDYFGDLVGEMRESIHAGAIESLLKRLPGGIGRTIAEELAT